MSVGWPRATRVVPVGEADSAIRELRQAHLDEWRRHRSLVHFLSEEYPEEWAKVQYCRTDHSVQGAVLGPSSLRVSLEGCGCVPYCPACASAATNRRVGRTLRAFQRCTPKGQEPRFLHIVQRATYYPDGTGWGRQASEDHAEFARLVFEVLRRAYGEGVGAIVSYHDVGEGLWRKRTPHLDLTLNGWTLEDGRPAHVKRYELRGDGHDRWQRWIAEAVERRGWTGTGYSSVDFQDVTVGVPAYINALRYQLREVIDLRKVEYSRRERKVSWKDYRNNYRRGEFTVDEFKAGLVEYARRLKPWTSAGRRPLDRILGHMADRAIGKTEDAMDGGASAHWANCTCGVCRGWRFVETPQLDREVGRGAAVPVEE